MSFTIYTFNDGYQLYLLMNGLRTYFSSSTWGSLVFLAVSVLTLIGILTVQQRSVLGYGRAEIAVALRGIDMQALSLEDIIKAALKKLM